MSLQLVLFAACVSVVLADITIDLSTAEQDPSTGQFCVVQKVCVANPPSALTSAGCAPVFPPGCNCDPEASPEDSTCSASQTCVGCRCLEQGCDCDPTAENPDSFCPIGDMCVDCQCKSPLPPGCNCDPEASPEDSTCSASETCVQCRCLQQGCDCDPTAENPDSLCPAGDKCVDCQCKSPLPPGCDCDPEAADPNSFCADGLLCVGCKCQACPQSSQGRLGQASDRPLNPPLVFVIDTTKSVKPDKDSIFNLTGKVTDRIMKDRINIPRYTLISFNDFGPAINLNVKLELDTDSVEDFARATRELKFESYNGGRDSKERLAQGLLVALQNASPKSLVVVFTDNGSKDLMLEKDIVRLRKSKEIEVFIVLTPAYEGRFNGPSLPAFSRMGKVFLINEVGADSFLQRVEEFEEENCI